MRKQFMVIMLMMVPVFVGLVPAVPAIGPTQPPVDTSTLYVGAVGWGPTRADPVRAYDFASGQLIFNTYDTLIVFGAPVTNTYKTWDVHEQYWNFSPGLSTNVPTRVETTKTVTNTSTVNLADPAGSTWSDGSSIALSGFPLAVGNVVYMHEADGSYRTWIIESMTAGATVTLNLARFSYTFTMRGGTINFFNETGAAVDTFTVADAEYSFERGLVQDQYGSPMWMYYKPMFDQMNSDGWTDGVTLAHLIDDAFEVSESDFTINLGFAYPDVAFKQILAQTWGSIVSKEFSISIGCWNGDLYTLNGTTGNPLWYEPAPSGWRHVARSPYDTIGAGTVGPGNRRYCGTGPYHVAVYNSALGLVVLTRNLGYWKGWPAPDRKDFLEEIDIEYIADWATRRDAFKAGQLDVCAVPRAYMSELLDSSGDPAVWSPPDIAGNASIISVKNISPVLSDDALFFTFTVDEESPYVPMVNGTEVPNFFNDTNVRKAFAYAFNHTDYIHNAYGDEGIIRETPLVFGLVPDYYTGKPGTGPWTYDANYTAAQAALTAAGYWTSDFTVCALYNAGNEARRLASENLKSFFDNFPGTHGTFTVIPQEVNDWGTYVDYAFSFYLPIWYMGWLADFPDAENWVRPFMHSYGDFSYYQNYTLDNGWGATSGTNYPTLNKDDLIDLAIKTPDGMERANMYADLDKIYLEDVPGYPIVQPTGRRWQKYWVRGWYYNALYPSDYYYHLYKEDTPWADISSAAAGRSDGVVDVRDLGYVTSAIGAEAPDPSSTLPYKYPLWAPGAYGCGGCDVYPDRVIDFKDYALVESTFGYMFPLSGTHFNYGRIETGWNVKAYPTGDVMLIFDNVTEAGSTIGERIESVPPPPLNFTSIGQYYDIVVNASFSGDVNIEIIYDDSNMTQQEEDSLQLFQWQLEVCDVTGSTPGVPDGIDNMRDIGYFANRFMTNSSSPNWDPRCDVTGPPPGAPDGVVDMRDIGMAASHFGCADQWVNITLSVDTAKDIIYGITTHFSLIGIHKGD